MYIHLRYLGHQLTRLPHLIKVTGNWYKQNDQPEGTLGPTPQANRR